ncbi:helix-turn-helix transcriptional regulator [Geobacter sp. FeAm09]|uniref:helix-turn-helix domain-containing protein n=1 Tax=Geobacter sp. FeAm09 TaxID=2597769 RepID=UPI0011ECAB76|nr:helix-turn-helix transcriptional regulator [Geobacter sp. FeAm09]QEM66713.1 helix-turn-helix transcriptional regulator [Geobacter sp. FeAm09]
MTPGERLKIVREGLSLTQGQLGESLGFKWTKVKDIELGKQRLTPEAALAIEKIYSVNFKWLLVGEGNMERRQPTQAAPENLTPLPPEDLSEMSIRFLQLPSLLDLTDEEFCAKIEMDMIELDRIRAGRPVPGLVTRAVAFEYGIRMRWLKLGEIPFRNPSGAPDHLAQDLFGVIELAHLKKGPAEG